MILIFNQKFKDMMVQKKKKKLKGGEEEELEYEEGVEENIAYFENKIKKLKKKLEECRKEKEEYLKGWQKERADFINFKKGEEERIKNKEKEIKMELIKKILPILDNLEMAEKNLSPDLRDNNWAKGIINIKKEMIEILKREGVREIENNEFFDPVIHEAVAIQEGKNDDKIIEVFQKGYYFEDKLLRPARVKVEKNIKKN